MAYQGSRSRILLVDDDQIVLETLSHGLRNADYIVEQCGNARDAMASYKSTPPDLAIVDIGLPDMRGTQLAHTLLHHRYRPILILSSHSEPEWVDQAIGSGVIGYLVKPLSVEQLIPSIETALVRSGEINQRIAHQFGDGSVTGKQLGAVMDQFSFGVVIIDSDHHIIHANRLARELLAAQNVLLNLNGKLRCTVRSADFIAILDQSLSNSRHPAPAMLSVPDHEHEADVQIWGTALPGQTDAPGQSAIIVINDPTLTTIARASLLKTLYGLTRKEIKLAHALVEGLTIKQYCEQSFISPNTARSHLKSIYRKTATNRQVELIRLLTNLFIKLPGE